MPGPECQLPLRISPVCLLIDNKNITLLMNPNVCLIWYRFQGMCNVNFGITVQNVISINTISFYNPDRSKGAFWSPFKHYQKWLNLGFRNGYLTLFQLIFANGLAFSGFHEKRLQRYWIIFLIFFLMKYNEYHADCFFSEAHAALYHQIQTLPNQWTL